MISYEGCVFISFCVYVITCYTLEFVRNIDDRVKDTKGTISLSVSNLFLGSSFLLNLKPWIQMSLFENIAVTNIAFQLANLFFIADSMFYFSHRLLHVPWVYQRYHKLHHRHVSPISWTALYVHPGEFACAFFGIFFVPPFIVNSWCYGGIEPIALLIFWNIIMISLVASHSGLFFAQHHELHHNKQTVNFGSKMGLWDRLFGTNE